MGAIQDTLIKIAIRKVIKDSNSKIDFAELIAKTGSQTDVDKKLVVRITDMDDNTGLGILDGKLVEVEKVEKPDTIFSMNKNTFSSILLGKIDHRQAYFIGAIECDGANWVRDSILLGKVFDEIKKAMSVKK